MFKDLKQGFAVHILDKTSRVPVYKTGTVVNATEPRIDTQASQQGTAPIPNMYAPKVIDLTIDFDGVNKTYVVPELGMVASAGAFIMACDTATILNEVRAMHKTSSDAIAEENIATHRKIVESCEDIMGEIDKSFADSKATNERIDRIEEGLKRIESLLTASSSKSKGEK